MNDLNKMDKNKVYNKSVNEMQHLRGTGFGTNFSYNKGLPN